MKHIKKKFLVSHKLEDDAYSYLSQVESDKEVISKIIAEDFKDYVPHMITDSKEYIQCFKYTKNGKSYFIPEPNPIVIYFSNAQIFLQQIEENRQQIFELLETSKSVGNLMNAFYKFFGFVSNYVTSLFNSLEAFINLEIPNNFRYIRESNRKTEIFNKEQIQREIQFEEKIKKVMSQVKTKNFHRHHAHKYEILINFKNFRDEIVHTKVTQKDSPNYYQNLFTMSLDFDYKKTIETVKDYINYYSENLIEKCDCGNDY